MKPQMGDVDAGSSSFDAGSNRSPMAICGMGDESLTLSLRNLN